MKKVLKNRKFYMFTAVFLSLFGLLAYFISAAFMNKGSVQFKAYTGYYESNQYPITDIVDQDGESYYSISKFYSWDNSKTPEKWTVTANPSEFDSSKYIGIDNITELVAFSRLCNPDLNPGSYTSFLGYSYILTNNIKSTGASTYFIPVGTDTPFSGVFNGNGYDITNLSFLNIQYSGEEDRFKTAFPKTQAHIEYYSMFAENSGTITNFGLINANMAFNYASTGQFDKVAMICGKNTGTISQVYVRDLRDAANNRSGIMPFGGYSISGLVFTNNGTVKNCYTAYNSVVNGTVDDYLDFAELIYEGSKESSGTNLFFFNESISKIGPSTEYTTAQNYDGQTMDISYSSLGYSATRKVYGSYCQTLPILNTAVLATNSDDDTVQPGDDDYVRWYVASESKYGVDIATDLAVVMETPILRGLEFNDGVFSVKNVKDYAFMYEMFNANAALVGSEYKYQIENNIVLSSLDSSRYYYKGAIAATITGKGGTYSGATINGEVAEYPTIFYPDYVNTYVTVEGFNAFGLFPYVTGEISNLNIVATKKATNEKPYSDLNIYVNNGNISTFGIVSGYIDSGRINNVNVYGAINFKGAAKAFVGGAVGTLTGNATVENVTTSGQLKLSTTAYTNSGEGNIEQNGFMLGNAIAGGVGYITNVSANLNGILNTMNLATSGVDTSFDLVVGGVLGAGYTTICENLQNEGTIIVGTGTETANQAKYANLYVAGVIGRHLGQVDQSNGMTNYGTVTVYNNATYHAYVCGTVNVTPITANNDAYLLSNIYKTNGKYYYRASKIINGANVTISATGENAHYVDTINVITNQCITKLSGVYNLAYSKSRKDDSQTALHAKTILMNTYDNYAPVINYECNTSSYDEAVLQTVYNLRDISFTMDSAITNDLHYAGVAKGTKIQLIDVRNEGNLTFVIDKALTGDLFVSGIIEEISANSKAASLYNGGDIDVTYTAQITGNVWLSGICYKNNNTSLKDDINNYNPNLDSFDANALGSIDATINAGNITLTNTNYETGITYTPGIYSSANAQQLISFKFNPTYDGSYIEGNINVAGISNINYSVITNTFNIGDIFVANACKQNGYKMNVAGITDLNIGQYAYILNSANNGDIKAINLYSSGIKTDLTVSGIIARNDLTDTLANYSSNLENSHSKQVVAFTINYGSIYAYNYNENVEGSNQEPTCKASAIIGMGLLNVVNVLNYGNVFGSETVAGIFGVVYFERFNSEVTSSNNVKIANTINYGNTFILYKGYNSGDRQTQAIANGSYDHNIITYSMFKEFDLNYDTFEYTGKRYYPQADKTGNTYTGATLKSEDLNGTQQRIDYANYSVSREVSFKSINGSIFSIINFGGKTNAQYVKIRYLINFEENAPLVGFEPNTPSGVSVNRNTIYSAYSTLDTRNNGSGQLVRDTYMAYNSESDTNYVVYSPLTDETGASVKAVNTNSTIDVLNASDVHIIDLEYNGVFSKKFAFYDAITKTYTKAQINENPTDAFLGDFFQFVEYSYINEVLVDKIGWKEIAYAKAANTFARSTSNVNTLLNKFTEDGVSYTNYTTYALNNTSIWTKWATNETLTTVIIELIEKNNVSDLETMLEYIFSSDSDSNVLITKDLREELFEIISKSLSEDMLLDVLTKVITYENGYSKELADAILENNNEVHSFINEYLELQSADTIKNLLQAYINILDGKTTEYFSYSSNQTERYEMLSTMFDNINFDYFYQVLCEILNITDTSSIDDKTMMIEGYNTLSTNKRLKYELFLKIFDETLNSNSNIDTYLSSMEGEIGYYARLAELGYTTTNITDTYTNINITNATSNDNDTTVSERVALWNQLKTTRTFRNYLKSKMTDQYYYFKATEHNNTYQSTTAPNPNGATDGDLSYYYTTSISPATYFYGPYKSANADGTGGVEFNTQTIVNTNYTYFDYLDINQFHSLFIADSLKYVSTFTSYNFNKNDYDVFTNQDSQYSNEIGINKIQGVLPATLYMYEYGYTGANNQFANVSILKTAYYQGNKTDFDGNTAATITDFGGTTLKTTDAYMKRTENGEKIYLSNATISYHVDNARGSGKFQIIDKNGNKYTISSSDEYGGQFIIYDDNIVTGSSLATNLTYLPNDYAEINGTQHYIKYKNSGDRNWGDFIYRYGRNYYFSEVDATYHRTKKTGIYEATGASKRDSDNVDGYDEKNVKTVWFTHKTKAHGVYTSQYMDYTIDQLLELDGYLTKFDDGTTQSSDERNIINSIFKNYLCTETNRNEFKQIIRKSLLERLSFSENSVYTVVKLDSVINTISSAHGTPAARRYNSDLRPSIDTYGDDWYNGNNGISGKVYYDRWTGENHTRFEFNISTGRITAGNGNNVTAQNVSITVRRYDPATNETYSGNESNPEVNTITWSRNNGVLTLSFISKTNTHNFNDEIVLTFNITRSNNNIVTSATLNTTVVNYEGHTDDTGAVYDSNYNWRKSATSLGGIVYYDYNNNRYTYNISVTNISYDKDCNLLSATPTITGTRGNTSITNSIKSIKTDQIGNVFTVSFICYDDGMHYVSVPITIEFEETLGVSVDSPFSVNSNSNNHVVSSNNQSIATVHTSDLEFTSTVDFDNTKYNISDIELSNSNKTISFVYLDLNKINFDYIDQFVLANINSDEIINAKIPFDYLKYSSTQTIKEYLESLITIDTSNYKSKLILKSIKDEKTYYSLFKKLLELNVLTSEELSTALNVTVTDASGVNTKLNDEISTELYTSGISYSGKAYRSSNKYGFTASSLTLSDYNYSDIIIVAKGASANSSMTVTANCTAGDRNITSELNVVSSSSTNSFNGTVSQANTYLYVIPQTSMYDMVPITNFEYDTVYYTYDSNSKTYTAVNNGNPLFQSGTNYYVDNGGQYLDYVDDVTVYSNSTQLYYASDGYGYPNNDTSLTYYKKVNTKVSSIVLTFPNSNVIVYDIIQDAEATNTHTYSKDVEYTYYYYWQNNETYNNNVLRRFTLDSLSDIQGKVSSSSDYLSNISNGTSVLSNEITTLGHTPITNTYTTSYSITSVDSQFVLYNSYDDNQRRKVNMVSILDETLNGGNQYATGTKANVIFTSVGTLSENEFNSSRYSLYYRNGNTSGNVYGTNNLSTNNFLGNDGYYYSKVDFATINNSNITISKGTYSNSTEYYTITYGFENALAQFYGKYNASAILTDDNSYINTYTESNDSIAITATTDNNAKLIAARYNMQNGVIGKSIVGDEAYASKAQINAGVFVLGNYNMAVLSADSPKDNSLWTTVRNSLTGWIDESNFNTYSKLIDSSTTVSTNPVSSDSIADSNKSTRYSRLIDANSFNDLAVNLYDSTNPSNSRLGHKIGFYKAQPISGNNNQITPNNYAYSISIENSDNIIMSDVIFKVSYKITYSMDYTDSGNNSIISFRMVDENKYLSARFHGTTNNHNADYRDVLANLLPLCTNDYAYIKATTEELTNNFDAVNLYEATTDSKGNMEFAKTSDSTYNSAKTYYKKNSTYVCTIKNWLLKYLSDNQDVAHHITIDGEDYTFTIENLYKLLTCYSNEAFIRFLNSMYQENPSNLKAIYTSLLKEMLSSNGGYLYVADYIDEYNSKNLHNTDTLIRAAYLASDYENLYQQALATNNNKLLYNSQLRKLLTASNVTIEDGTSIQYINSDGTFDNDKFDALLEYIGLGGNNDVYGIYALASSQGIKNGDFIPDNLNLSSHDAYYKRDKIGNEDNWVWVLIPETSTDYANWRLYGETDSTKYADEYPNSNNSTAKSDSVNYAFYVDMKQLKKSIATTLFEFDLSTNINGVQVSAYTMYSSQDLINEVTKASDATEKAHYSITYYVPTIYLKDIVENNDTLKVDEIIISSKAHAYKGEFTDKNIDVSKEIVKNSTTYNGGSFVLATNTMNSNYNQLAGCYVYENALTIFAEDTRVYSYFDILLKPIDFSFDMEYQKTNKAGTSTETTNYDTFGLEESTVPALNGIVSLKITSPIYVASSDNEFKQGSVYYELVDGEYVLTEDPTKQQNKTYYSVYTKATESTAISGRTYYTKSGDTYTACNPQPTDLTLTTYYIASNATKLPKGFDLSPYVKVQRIKDNDELEEVSNAYEISNEMGDHIVKEDGSADVKLFISDDLAKGDYWIVIDLYGCDERVKLHKLGNTDTTLELIYDGNPVSFDENNEATTYILWGQPFSKYDLHNLLYLDSYTKAPNSELTITEIFTTENINTANNVPYDIGTYTVKITVTPEEGNAVTYTHKLIEKDPFRDNGTILDNYGTLYKDGIVVGSPKLNTPSTGDLTVTDNIIYESFSRDQGEPNYRVKYSFKNVYYSLNDYDYTYEEYNLANQLVTTDSSVTTLYAGFNVVVTSGCDTGTYTFGYVYNNCTFYDNVYYEKVTKDGVTTYFESPDAVAKEGKTYYSYDETTGEYVSANLAPNTVIGEQRKLVFPKLRIIKTPSKNALVDSATFLDQYEALGALATLVYPNGAIVPSSSALSYDSKTEAIYSELINGSQRISVDPTNRKINYEYVHNNVTTDYATDTNDYYIVGTTSEAELERYAPTLTLQDTYSKVFRFASTTRNVQYKGNQDATDASILNAHTDEDFIYLYVPFVGSDESSIVLAVKTTLKDMTYTEVMSQDFKTQYASSSADTNPLLKPLQEGDDPNVDRSYKGKELYDLTFTYGNVTYTVNKNAGSVSKDNESLYDNYAVECENGRFWYVSYVVFSEDFFLNGLGVDAKDSTYNTTTSNWGTRIKFYNVAIIDVSNNIRFILEVDAPKGFSTEYLNNIYVTFAYNKYTSTIMTDSKQLSAYVAYATQLYTESGGTYTPVDAANLNGSTKYYFFDYTSNGYREVEWSTKGTVYDTFVSEYGLQLLPTAYYRFNLDLPNGYVATYKVSKANTYDPVNTQISEDGAYLPPSSIVTQTIKVTITIKEGTTADQSSWGISTSNVSTVVATEETAQ